MSLRGKGCIAPKLCGGKNEGSKTLGAKSKGSITPQGKFTFILCPAELWSLCLLPVEFWTPCSLLSGVLEQCNLFPANLWRHSLRGQNNHKNYLKIWYSYFLKVIFVNHCHFRDLYSQYDHLLRKTYFAGRDLKRYNYWQSSLRLNADLADTPLQKV